MQVRAGAGAPSRRDFPFYAGAPVRISAVGWLVVLAFAAAGFAALTIGSGASMTGVRRWCGVMLFVLLPLVGLRLAAGAGWKALFPRPTARDLWIGLAFTPLALLVSAAVALLTTRISLTAANPAVALLGELGGWPLALFAASTLPQLLGEELVAVIPFLAILSALNGRAPRRVAILIAWTAASLIFGALHLPTYQWHVLQALAVIGSARFVLLVPYLITKNLWSSTLAHVANDWIGFGTVMAITALKA